MKYIIVKALLGFGDRLQSLKMCVRFALDNNLQIYVDWTDDTWSHGKESFYNYFKLVNIPILASINDIPANATVYPARWKGKLHEKLVPSILSPEMDLGTISGKKFNADVIVYSCCGYRNIFNDSTFFANVFRVIDPRIIQKVQQRQSKYTLSTKIGIHLRGTDRASKIDKSHRMAGLNIRMLHAGLLGGKEFIAVTDDAVYAGLWKTRFPQFPILSNLADIGGSEGTHHKRNLSVSKDDMNVELLVDFFTLASCKYIISTSKDSRFACESTRLHPHIKRILNPTS
jgi:hypothetical protein